MRKLSNTFFDRLPSSDNAIIKVFLGNMIVRRNVGLLVQHRVV